jgi:hypothetical protein
MENRVVEIGHSYPAVEYNPCESSDCLSEWLLFNDNASGKFFSNIMFKTSYISIRLCDVSFVLDQHA